MARRWTRHLAGLGPPFIIAGIAIATLAARSTALEHRPVHGDEANQAYKTGKLLETGRYVYDAHDHHGPTLYYAALIPLVLTGTNSLADADTATLRLVPVAFSAATILLLILVHRELGTGATVCAALLLTCSPAFTYYSRYFIQESLLVFFTLAAMVCGIRFVRRPSMGWAIVLGLALSLAHATKETAALAYVAGAFAIVVLWSVHRIRGDEPVSEDAIRLRHLLAGITAGLAATILMYSAFFTHWRGPLDSVLTYQNYFRRAGGAGIHDKPWDYYLSLLWYTKRGPGPWWSEGHVLLLGAAGAAMAFLSRPPEREDGPADLLFARFLAIFTIALGFLYSAIPYKTPWTVLSTYFGVTLLAGFAVARAIGMAPGIWRRALLVGSFGIVLGHLALQSWRAETVYAADVRNPYVYAHTSTALVRFVEQVADLASVHPDGRNLSIKIVQPDADYWPLPWYFRRYSGVRFLHAVPEELDADIVIVDSRIVEAVATRLRGAYFGPTTAGLRPGVLRAVYVRQELWDAYMQAGSAAR